MTWREQSIGVSSVYQTGNQEILTLPHLKSGSPIQHFSCSCLLEFQLQRCFRDLKEIHCKRTLLIRGYPETTRREQSVGVSSVYETGIERV